MEREKGIFKKTFERLISVDHAKEVKPLNLFPQEEAQWKRNDQAFKNLDEQRQSMQREMDRITRNHLRFIGRESAEKSFIVKPTSSGKRK